MTQLTPSQLTLLTTAAEADDGYDMPDPRPAALAGLIKRGLALVIPKTGGGERIMLTEAGRAALKPDAATEAPSASEAPTTGQAEPQGPSAASVEPQEAPPPPSEPRGKLGVLVGLLRRPEGATLADIVAATCWQAHSVRGAIAGAVKKKLGLTVISAKADGVRVYRIPAEA